MFPKRILQFLVSLLAYLVKLPTLMSLRSLRSFFARDKTVMDRDERMPLTLEEQVKAEEEWRERVAKLEAECAAAKTRAEEAERKRVKQMRVPEANEGRKLYMPVLW